MVRDFCCNYKSYVSVTKKKNSSFLHDLPFLSSSQFFWQSCASVGGLRAWAGWRWDLQTGWTAFLPAFQHLSACSQRWCSQCGTCGTFSSPEGQNKDNRPFSVYHDRIHISWSEFTKYTDTPLYHGNRKLSYIILKARLVRLNTLKYFARLFKTLNVNYKNQKETCILIWYKKVKL